jgi:regulator of nonsense transcripts 2
VAVASNEDAGAGKKRRIQIRYAIELFQAGIWTDDGFFPDLLRFLLGKTNKLPMDLLGLGTFVKYASELLLGYVPRRVMSLARVAMKSSDAIPTKQLASARVSNELRAMVNEVFSQLTNDLVKAHRDLRSKEKRFEKDRLLHGSITEQKQAELDANKKLFERLHSTVVQLAECMNEEIPELTEEAEEVEESAKAGLSLWDGQTGSSDYRPFDDAESKAFYEDLPDLLASVPLKVLGLTPEQATDMREEWRLSKERRNEAVDIAEGEEKLEGLSADMVDTADAGPEADITEDGSEGAEGGASAEDTQDTPAAKLRSLLQDKLPECHSKQKADEFSTSFCYCNTKNARKRLVAALIRVPLYRADTVAAYARIIASLSRLYSDIAGPVLNSLLKEFTGQLKNIKSQKFVDVRIKNVRFISELVKFNVAPPITGLRMLRNLMYDFSANNIELLSLVMECCGRYLYLLPHTKNRMDELLETMLRLRRAKHVDVRLAALLEAAYFTVRPPERVKVEKKILTTLHQYVKYLIIEKLATPGADVDDVIDHIRRLPWASSDERVEDYTVSAFLSVAKKKYTAIPGLADCLAGLNRYDELAFMILGT